MSKINPTQQVEAFAQLHKLFPRGATVTTLLRHVSQSGMTRCISIVASTPDEGITDVSWLLARALGVKLDPKYGGIKRVGAGMDMGFDLVHTLSLSLYSDGYALRHRWL